MSAIDDFVIDGNGGLSKYFFEIQKSIMPDYSIEVGAHAAEFSIIMAKNFSIPTTAFEAGTEIFNLYSKNAIENSVNYLNLAISNIDDEISFLIHENPTNNNNSIKQRTNTNITKQYNIKSCKLDTYFKNIDFLSACLWIDAEGANKEVLLGATNLLNRVSSIFIETEDHMYWKDQWLTEDVVTFLESNGFIKLASEKIYDNQQNIIFVKKGAISDNKTN